MYIQKYSHITSIKKEYTDFYNKIGGASPYLSFDWMLIVGKGARDKKPFERLFVAENNYVLYDESHNIKCIAPLLIKKSGGIRSVTIRGFNTPAEPLDFLYGEMQDGDFDFLFEYLIADLKPCEFLFSPLLNDSKLSQYCQKRFRAARVEHSCSYQMKFENYENWYDGLTKNARQNIRTAYNRMNTDGQTFLVRFIYSQSLTHEEYAAVNTLLAARLLQHMKVQNIVLSCAVKILKNINPASKGLNRSSNNYHCLLYIGGVLAGFCNGLYHGETLSVCRFAINTDFARYNPGAVIHNEMMKTLSEHSEIKMKQYIFSRGDEHYKLDYGGSEMLYNTIGITIK